MCLIGAGALAVAIKAIIETTRMVRGRPDVREISPQPLVVTPADQWVTRDESEREHAHMVERVVKIEQTVTGLSREIAAVRAEVGGFQRELHEAETRINRAAEERSEKVHNRINDILAAVSELRGEITAHRQTGRE